MSIGSGNNRMMTKRHLNYANHEQNNDNNYQLQLINGNLTQIGRGRRAYGERLSKLCAHSAEFAQQAK